MLDVLQYHGNGFYQVPESLTLVQYFADLQRYMSQSENIKN